MSQTTAPCGGSYLLAETVRTLDEIAQRNDQHISAVYRWARQGLCGGRARLETYLRGSRWITSEEALIRFFDRVNAIRRGEPVDSGDSPAPLRRSAVARRKAAEAADKLAEALGA